MNVDTDSVRAYNRGPEKCRSMQKMKAKEDIEVLQAVRNGHSFSFSRVPTR